MRWFFKLAARLGYTCKRTSEDYTALDEDQLSPGDRRKMRAHLAVCWACRSYRDQLDAVRAAVKPPEPEAVLGDDKARLVAMFRARRGGGGDG